jgi:hypothetical protein
MRIGTWNLEGRWTPAQVRALGRQDCDIWLLTEVPTTAALDGYAMHTTTGSMAPGRRWAAVAAREDLDPCPLPDPHPASAAVAVDGVTFCSSVLPWRTSGGDHPWRGSSTAERTAYALGDLTSVLPVDRTVWGGDWNHAVEGPEHAGSRAGREAILDAATRLGLTILTTGLAHRLDGHGTIDHLAVPSRARVVHRAERVSMEEDGRHLSDHDAYVVEVALGV